MALFGKHLQHFRSLVIINTAIDRRITQMEENDNILKSDNPEESPVNAGFMALVPEDAPEGPPERKTSDELIEAMFSAATSGSESDDVPETRLMPDAEEEPYSGSRLMPDAEAAADTENEADMKEEADTEEEPYYGSEEDFTAYSD